MHLLPQTFALFFLTAVAEILGCYLPYLWLKEGRSPWLLVPGALALAAFAWLLSLHPTGAARTYAAYGGVYIAAALGWLWAVERQTPTRWDALGVLICLVGTLVIVLGPRQAAEPPPGGAAAVDTAPGPTYNPGTDHGA